MILNRMCAQGRFRLRGFHYLMGMPLGGVSRSLAAHDWTYAFTHGLSKHEQFLLYYDNDITAFAESCWTSSDLHKIA